jgi:hypothetical protein
MRDAIRYSVLNIVFALWLVGPVDAQIVKQNYYYAVLGGSTDGQTHAMARAILNPPTQPCPRITYDHGKTLPLAPRVN